MSHFHRIIIMSLSIYFPDQWNECTKELIIELKNCK